MHSPEKFINYSWITSLEVSKIKGKRYGRFFYFLDILYFGFKYNATTIDYMELKYYEKNRKERENEKVELIMKRDYKNRVDREIIILSKYSSRKYENHRKWHKRNKMYKKSFNMGDDCWVQFNVWIYCAHEVISSKFVCGNKVKIQRNADIDYTGGVEIGNGVGILEGVKILTHSHDYLGLKDTPNIKSSGGKRTHLSKLIIEDNVTIGSRAIIMPGVGRIGENSIISAGSIVRKQIPPNAMVAGNPAEIVTIFPVKRRSKRWNEED